MNYKNKSIKKAGAFKLIVIGMFIFSSFSLNAQCWKSVVAGYYHNSAIKSDGTLWGWGGNGGGQVGDGTTTNKPTPIQIGTASNWTKVAAGKTHSIGLKSDGTLWAWGDNSFGQLGIGNKTRVPAPVQVGTDTTWYYIEGAENSSFAIKKDGTLWAWGTSSSNHLGLGTSESTLVPTQVGSDSNWALVSSNYVHTLAIKTNGTLWAWGQNVYYGALGDGTYTNRPAPIQIGKDTTWAMVSTGNRHTIATKRDGTLWAWGYNDFGSVGDNTTIQRNIPKLIGSGFSDINAGQDFAIATKGDGTLWAWGRNDYNALGDSSTIDRFIPVKIGSDTNWVNVSAGYNHSMGLKKDGSLYGWGWNINGQLANGNTTNGAEPVLIKCLTVGVSDLIKKETLIIFPNPSNGNITLTLSDISGSNKLTVYNLSGEILHSEIVNQQTTTLNLKLAAGLYFVSVDKNGQKSTRKIIIK